MQTLLIKKINEKAIIPKRATKESAGLDLCACIESDMEVKSGETKKIPTGISISLPKGTVGLIFGRSGLGINFGLVPGNAVGVIDSDYRGELIVGMHNHSGDSYVIKNGERIAQLVIVNCLLAKPVEVEELPSSERGVNGFGSSGRI